MATVSLEGMESRIQKSTVGVGSAPIYQLDKREVDVGLMVSKAVSRLPFLQMIALRRALTSRVWGEDFPSLKDMPSRSSYNGFRVFEPKTGTVLIPGELPRSDISAFFTPERRIDRCQKGFIVLRGPNYYQAVDQTKGVSGKVETMKNDMHTGLDVLQGIDRTMLGDREYLALLGILDYLKLDSLTMFHAVTHREKTGVFPRSLSDQIAKEAAGRNMFQLTRAFYQACLGQPFDREFDPDESKKGIERVGDFIVSSASQGNIFTLPEATHPLRMMLGSHQAVLSHPNTEKVVGVPSGGTEASIVTAYMYELLRNTPAPEVSFVPLSLHDTKQGLSQEVIAEILRKANIGGRSVLIVDDNSNTGTTLQRIANAALKVGASSIHAHTVELDPGRILQKADKLYNGKDYVVNLEHPDFETALGIVPITPGRGKEVRRRIAQRVLRIAHSGGTDVVDPKVAERMRRKELRGQMQV